MIKQHQLGIIKFKKIKMILDVYYDHVSLKVVLKQKVYNCSLKILVL